MASDDCCATGTVLGGTFKLGYDTGDLSQTPPGFQTDPPTVSISDFALDEYEVTVGRFAQFLAAYDVWRSDGNPRSNAGGNPNNPPWTVDGGGMIGAWETAWNGVPQDVGSTASEIVQNIATTCNQAGAPPDSGTYVGTFASDAGPSDSLPMTCVNWYEAYMFCIWDGARLPTEAEWEYAAADGSVQRPYPWPGSAATLGSSQALIAPADVPDPVGSLPQGRGAFGQYDMAGNVYEWAMDSPADVGTYAGGTSNPLDLSGESSGQRVVRGGSFDWPAYDARTSARVAIASTDRYRDVGFRCARPATSGP